MAGVLSAAAVRAWSREKKAAWVAGLSPEDAELVLHHWPFFARPDQLPPASLWWFIILFCAGRGFGKTRLAAEYVHAEAMADPSACIGICGATAADIRQTMIEGPSGILNVGHPRDRPTYHSSRRRIDWPNGAYALTYSGEEPERMRGANLSLAWCDELAAWKRGDECFSLLKLCLRRGAHPRIIVTTTPKPKHVIREMVKVSWPAHGGPPPDKSRTVALVTGSTYDNLANLSPTFREQVLRAYEGTRLGRQELMAEILDDVPGALLTRAIFDRPLVPEPPPMLKIVVGIDPAATSSAKSDNTGIIAAGLGEDRVTYVIEDATMHAKPLAWATRAVELALELEADLIVGEVNNGGEMVESMLDAVWSERARQGKGRTRIPFKAIHASRGKRTRAEPVAALYEQGRVRHCQPMPHLEDEWCTWDPLTGDASPDRVDACVYCVSELTEGAHRIARRPLDLTRQPQARRKGPLS